MMAMENETREEHEKQGLNRRQCHRRFEKRSSPYATPRACLPTLIR
jgi:hypothetical protein